jgi:circadian clock protein KaiC
MGPSRIRIPSIMKSLSLRVLHSPAKAATGIVGLDEITGGGLPRGRTTLVVGGPGSGKTILALHFLSHGAGKCGEPGIFVAFEESAARIVSNAQGFGWGLAELRRKKLYFMDAQPLTDLVQSGDFDLGGMLAALDNKRKEMGATRIVFDALDVVLALLPDQAARTREIYRLHEWLMARGLTALITAKADADETRSVSQAPFRYMLFMVDCAVILNHTVVKGVSQRSLRVQKYRGSSFDENEAPFLIGASGVDVAVTRTRVKVETKQIMERISTGVDRLDTMLGGGYYRGASVLITGVPGTAKTTLSGAFAEAACNRGEPTLFISFDSDASEVIRNLKSVGIRLERYVKNGSLRIVSARTLNGSSESYLVLIKALAKEQRAVCVVVDPLSALLTPTDESTAHRVAERLIDWSKAEGITLLCTNLLDETARQESPASRIQISTLADTWIHLNYQVQAGERNRGLSIIKSRGTAHSNQVRELILSETGVTLTDAYTAGGEVLMGTQRWAKESADRVANEVNEVAANLKRVKLDAEEAEIEVRVKALQVQLVAKQVEKALLASTTQSHKRESKEDRTRMRELRGADVAIPLRK